MIKNLVDNLYTTKLDDFWYDVQIDVVEDILNKFSEQDWEELKKDLPFDNEYQNQSLIEGLSSCENDKALDCVDKIISSGKSDIETLKSCVLTLGDKISELQEQSKQELVKKYSEIIDSSNKSYSELLIEVLKNIL